MHGAVKVLATLSVPAGLLLTAGRAHAQTLVCPPGQVVDNGHCIPDPLLAEPEDSSGAPTWPALTIQVGNPGPHFAISVQANGVERTCAVVDAAHPCVIDDLPTGAATISTTGSGTIQREITLAPGRTTVTLRHDDAANGVVGGLLFLTAGAALGAAGVATIYVCTQSAPAGSTQAPPCGDWNPEGASAVGIPLAIAGASALALGIGMLAWRRPERNDAEIQGPGMARANRPGVHLAGWFVGPSEHGAAAGLTLRF